jgi:hypothetical protein
VIADRFVADRRMVGEAGSVFFNYRFPGSKCPLLMPHRCPNGAAATLAMRIYLNTLEFVSMTGGRRAEKSLWKYRVGLGEKREEKMGGK